VEAEEWIGKKGIAAKGKKCAERGEVKSVRFIEPLIVDEPEPDETDEPNLPDNEGDSPVEPANDTEVVIPAEPVVIPEAEPESPASLDDVPDIPGSLFEEPTLF
jgi:hypothetical protein